MKMRLDQLLVHKKLCRSRTLAQDMITSGQVAVIENGELKTLNKASQLVDQSIEIILQSGPQGRFVSRGGLKLEGALKRVSLNIHNFCCLDVGQSTGGFTDCILRGGARRVIGVDVGHDQLDVNLRSDARVTYFEGLHVRDLSKNELFLKAIESERAANLRQAFDLIVIDVSFISLTQVIDYLLEYLKEAGCILALVKPQFEVGSENLSRGGVVKDDHLYQFVEKKIVDFCVEKKLNVIDYFESSIEGKDGNKEFFIYCGHSRGDSSNGVL